MCPDIETFAPLIGATFGAGEVSPDDDELDALPDELRPPDLRVRLADRSLRQTNAVLGFVSRLLELADQRLTASQVLDLADREPVRRRFGLDDDDVARVEEWVAQSGIRWGLDAAHRAPFKLDKLPAGTWRAGLDRVLLGVAMTDEEQRLFGGVLPLDDVESGAIDLAGRFAELIDRLQACVDGMRRPMTVGGWTAAIAAAADALTDTSPRDAWQRAELQRLLDDVEREAAVAGASATALALAEVRALLAERLEGRPTRTNFRTGHLTICTLVPMRSVPHRVVCLLGLDDGEFPRKSVRDGDDLVLRDPHVGDRDSRTEDRQMLLDALMAATDRLIVTYTGKDERTNTPRPPAVPVGELLDVIDATARVADGSRARDRVLVQHPLQPFDPRNFTLGELVPGRHWGFDRVTLQGARALGEPRTAPPPFLAAPLPDAGAPLVELDDLVRFAEHPVRAFLRQRLGIMLGDFDDEVGDALTVELDHLEQWGVGTRLLEGRLAGADMDACVAAEVARGLLPPGRLGDAGDRAAAPDGRGARGLRAAARRGRVALGRRQARARRRADPQRHRARHPRRPAARRAVLARGAQAPDRPVGPLARALGRPSRPADPGRADGAGARGRAGPGDDLPAARGRRRGRAGAARRAARPPPPRPARAAADRLRRLGGLRARQGEGPARKAWESDWNFPKEDVEPEHQLAFGGVLGFDELLAFAAARGRGLRARGADALRAPVAAAVGRAAVRRGAGGGMSTAFDVTGPLPTGVTVLEASAGTGKTYTIAALAARYVAEGMPLDELLLVTFTRMATGELRDRVRERLVTAEQGLARALAGAPPRPRRGRAPAVRGRARGGRAAPAAARARAGRLRLARRSRPRTASARRCSAGSAWRATSSRA